MSPRSPLAFLPTDIHGRDRAVLSAIKYKQIVLEWVALEIGNLKIWIMRDALQIVGDGAGFQARVGLSPDAQQQAADALDAVLLTPKLCDVIARRASDAGGLVGPFVQPINSTTEGYIKHSFAIDMALPARYLGIVAGWKDWCLSADVWAKPGRVTNYGWHVPKGDKAPAPTSPSLTDVGLNVIQRDYEAHGYDHADYSQLCRLVRRRAELDGLPVDLGEVYTGKHGLEITALVSHDGPLVSDRLPSREKSQQVSMFRENAQTAILRRGSFSPAVGQWQSVLNQDPKPVAWAPAKGGVSTWDLPASSWPLAVDDHFGIQTEKATECWQNRRDLVADGIVGPKTWEAASGLLPAALASPRETSVVTGKLSPLTQEARKELFGAFRFVAQSDGSIEFLDDWPKKNIVTIQIEELKTIPGISPTGSTIIGRGPFDGMVAIHKSIAEQTKSLWASWHKEGLLNAVLTWGGLWSPRFIRGSSSHLSAHAWATAFDINAPWNALGREPAKEGATGSVRRLVPLANEHGFFWGGDFVGRQDGMHFEAAKIL